MNFSFSGCGFLGIYHVGVASCLKLNAPELLKDCHFSGASAGAILACCLISDCDLGESTKFVLRLATKARSHSLGPLHPSFDLVQIMEDALMEFLPANAYEIATGRLHISLTRVSDRKNVMVSEFSSNQELIQALMCSAFVPLYSGLVPPKFRGVRYIDGGLSDNIPILNNETITVSPFAGESDICPTDNSSNFIHVNLANTSMQCSMGNLYRLSRALFPPSPQILNDMCNHGFEDCSRYLHRNNFLTCKRHMSVRSFVMPIKLSEQDIEVVINNHRACAMDAESNEDCQECKNKVKRARLHKLPPSVVSAFQSACDSVNKGVTAYIHRHRSLRLISYCLVPWFLPLDIAYNFTLRFLKFLPSLPHNLHYCCREIIEVSRAVHTRIKQEDRHYTARQPAKRRRIEKEERSRRTRSTPKTNIQSDQ
ncbi:hypothetical protein ACJMK2_020087 [Sinanodonta woodiana]|uniref:triacylglycerol lipase n=1 Tax=Sinanodonta woodiana TaxID=1069815 RepID=A0ABD3TXY1_SINWO